MILLNQLISAVLQIMLFSAVPFIWYVFTQKSVRGFFAWLGIKKATKTALEIHALHSDRILAVVVLPYLWLHQSRNLNYQGFTVDAFRAVWLECADCLRYMDLGCDTNLLVGGNSVSRVPL